MSIDILPSTFDGSYSDTDQVLGILESARSRYAQGAISGAYLTTDGGVCAIGAFGAAAGLDVRAQFGGDREDLFRQIEDGLRESAKAAIRLVEKATVTLFPEVKGDLKEGAFAIEQLNEGRYLGEYEVDEGDFDEEDSLEFWESRNKLAVLACYDYAIVRRRVEILHAYC
jgi:hypothetical protein